MVPATPVFEDRLGRVRDAPVWVIRREFPAVIGPVSGRLLSEPEGGPPLGLQEGWVLPRGPGAELVAFRGGRVTASMAEDRGQRASLRSDRGEGRALKGSGCLHRIRG